jgi:hypothetical protein
MADDNTRVRVLCIDVRSARFGFVVFEGPDGLLDFGVRGYARRSGPLHPVARRKFLKLVDVHSPSLIVLRLAPVGSDNRNRRAQMAARSLRQAAKRRSLPWRCLSRNRIKRLFEAQGLTTKYDIASRLAQRFRDLGWKLPRRRKPWQSEGHNMTIFDATAVGVAHFGWPDEKRDSG